MTEGIQGPGQSSQPMPTTPATPQQELEVAAKTPVKTLADLKRVLIEHLGEKNGKKMYNHFLKSVIESMLSQMRHSQQSADQATKSMGQNQPS